MNAYLLMKNLDHWNLTYEPCAYSIRLLDKILLLNDKAKVKVDLSEIKKAIYYAKKYHGSQKRQSGEPYYSHPLEVAYMASDYLFRTDILVTAILHDTIEDTDLTFEMIESIFGKLVAHQVLDLTRINENGRKISSAEMVQSLWLEKKYDILLIKHIDRLHNMQTIRFKSPEKIRKIVAETVSTFLLLAAYLEIPEHQDELKKICANIIFGPDINHLQNNKTLITDSFQLPSPVFQNVKSQN